MGNLRGSEWNRWDLHLHTQSSYDYRYRADNADDLLCDILRKNAIKAVAITDHFKIDANRIENLRSKASDIIFFPGVELRTDKGATNLHVILIFSEKIDLATLSSDFDAIMLRSKAKANDSNQTIYWIFEDIVSFAKEHDALISIHAGHKSNGIDQVITNALPVNQAIKRDIAEVIDFFEIGQLKDVDDYENKVFKSIDRKPLIMCSDCHNPNEYKPKESLWIKGELTFEGLKQCLYQPQERVFIGTIPPMLDRLNKNKQSNISQIEIHRIDCPSNDTVHWFNCTLPLNSGMVAIIGNKGSGKSALSDIIAHLCGSHTMNNASFLSNERFRKLPKNFSRDYVGTLTWVDGTSTFRGLNDTNYGTIAEDAQYLPQQYIEAVCNDIENNFQNEINNVIFSYITHTERGDTSSLEELIRQKSRQIDTQLQNLLSELHNQNFYIIQLERKKTKSYRKHIYDNLKKLEETLSRHEKSKPLEIQKPESKDLDKVYQDKLVELNISIEEVRKKILEVTRENVRVNKMLDLTNILLEKMHSLESQFNEIKKLWMDFISQHDIQVEQYPFELNMPKSYISNLVNETEQKKLDLQNAMNNSETGLSIKLKNLEDSKNKLISSANNDEKIYQKYLKDLREWEQKKEEIRGGKSVAGTLEYYKHELEYLGNNLDTDYKKAIATRQELVKKIYATKSTLVTIYQSIYAPAQNEIIKLLEGIESSISFQAEIFLKDRNITQNILRFINQKFNGKFGRGSNSIGDIENILHNTDLNDINSVIKFIDDVSNAATEDLENVNKKIPNCQEFYDFIYSLSYIDVTFKLKMGNRNLNELSAGERGIVLLIFYLALSQERKPIIIDQPEDNLDNQSIYKKLVPCICRAKQQRQVIIVTHNPNIAVACDAEQVIYCEMNKNTCQIRYESGAIENPAIRKHVIDVLEGTMPAFDLRRKKYM